MFGGEKGQALPIALVVLGLGGLMLAPFLGHVSANLIGSRIYGEVVEEQYAADAGIEFGIWHLLSGTTVVPEGGQVELPTLTLNSTPVNVTIRDLGETYEITSTAHCSDGSLIIITAEVTYGLPAGFEVIEGDKTFSGHATYTGDYYVTGDVSLENHVVIDGSIYAEGDITLNNHSTVINGDIVTAGTLTINDQTDIQGNVCVGENLIMRSYGQIRGDAHVLGNITMYNQTKIHQDAYVGGTVTLFNKAKILGDYPLTYTGCPIFTFGEGAYSILSWDITPQ
ncbi:MAG TPA: polymer-forming cytoskeletal protein [Dehalococcoidia bacterium]|nr:polymer-forming cytoskeletal protein [Dehalococcoidia bacterium]